jgi:tetratricopeptide (TPR) repeat protein
MSGAWTGGAERVIKAETAPLSAARLREGLKLHRDGDLAGAERLYQAVLIEIPEHEEALHYLGILAQQRGDLVGSVALIERALARRPSATAWSNLANALWLQGDHERAEAACRNALALDPNCAPAHQNLGNALKSRGRFDDAAAAYQRSLDLRPDHPDLLSNLGTVLTALGRVDEARTALEAALRIRPDFAAAHFNLGNLELAHGNLDAAVASYECLLALSPGHADGHRGRAAALHRAGRSEDALEAYRAAIVQLPDDAVFHGAQAELLLDLDRIEEAQGRLVTALARLPDAPDLHRIQARALRMAGNGPGAVKAVERAIALGASDGGAQLDLGAALRTAGDHAGAIAAYARAIQLSPDLAVAYANLGGVLHEEGRSDEATRPLLDGLKLAPNLPELHINLGGVRLAQNRFQDARAAFETALTLRPESAESLFGIAVAKLHQGDVEASVAEFEAALAIKELPEARWMLGLSLLKLGDYARGWREHDSRLDIQAKKKIARSFPQPRWQGEPLAGKTLLVHSEQGLGDTLQCLRFVPLITALGGRVILQVQEAILPLLKGLAGDFEAIGPQDTPPPFDYHCPLFSAPGALGVELATLPSPEGYLTPDPALVALWRTRLQSDTFKIGLVWQGNPRADVERGRSYPLRLLAPLAALPGVELVSLQKEHGLDQLEMLPHHMVVRDLGLDYEGGSFADTAAIVANLDLVITCDTSVGHLAGALGRPVWIAVNAVSDWRWLTDREDSPWYSSVRLFRQPSRGDWDSVVARMADALADRLGL